jgi:hypothetical protein
VPLFAALGDSSWRESFVDRGYLVKLCNETNQASSDLNLDYYIEQVEKLTMEINLSANIVA